VYLPDDVVVHRKGLLRSRVRIDIVGVVRVDPVGGPARQDAKSAVRAETASSCSDVSSISDAEELARSSSDIDSGHQARRGPDVEAHSGRRRRGWGLHARRPRQVRRGAVGR
jgi:hypothetical protein